MDYLWFGVIRRGLSILILRRGGLDSIFGVILLCRKRRMLPEKRIGRRWWR